MNKETEGNVNKNIRVREVENNKPVIKYSGITIAAIGLLEILANGDSLSPENQARVVAVVAISAVIGAFGSVLDILENS